MKAVNLLWHGVLAAVLFYMAAIPAASRGDRGALDHIYLKALATLFCRFL